MSASTETVAPPTGVDRTQKGWRVRPSLAVLTGLVLLLAGMTLNVTSGAIPVSATDAFAIIGKHAFNLPVGESVQPLHDVTVWRLRFPRILLAALAGAGLALAGVASQALVRNALADPFVLGVSSGATLGTVAVASAGIGLSGVVPQTAASVAGALGALLLVIAFGTSKGVTSPLRLVLCGIAIGHLLAGVTGYLIVNYLNAGAGSIQGFLAGNMENAKMSGLALPAVGLLVGFAILMLDAGRLNALLVGDETATSLGVNVRFLRWRLILLTAVLAGVMVAQTGIIGFVGLVVPHMARLLVGSDHRYVIPVAMVGGAAYLVWCDYIAHTVAEPQLLPIGLVAGGLGAPVFLWLIRRGLAKQGV